MFTPKKVPDIGDDISYLNGELLSLTSLLISLVGYVLFTWLLCSSLFFEKIPIQVWISGLLLILAPVIAYKLSKITLYAAADLLIIGIILSITIIIFEYSLSMLIYLFIIPITFASILLNPGAAIIVGLCCAALIGVISHVNMGFPLISTNVFIPIGIIGLITIFMILISRMIKDAFGYISVALDTAHLNEQMARENKAELARVLKSLDDVNYKLNRSNNLLSYMSEKANEAYRLKQQFAQNISHELRTPLNLIISFIELMTQSPKAYGGRLPIPYMRDLSVVYRNARHLQTLVNDVLDLAQIEAAQMMLNPEKIIPDILIDDVVTITQGLVESKGLKLLTEIEPNLPPIWVDPTRIRQVLINLINNAVRFTERGYITISVQTKNDGMVFAVADTGVGIEEKDIDRIFDEFQYIHDSKGQPHNGAGLGLSISRQFVKLHSGRIWVESQPGKGSTFYFSLPASQLNLVTYPHMDLVETSRSQINKQTDDSILLVITANPTVVPLLKRHLPSWHTILVNDLQQVSLAASNFLPQVVIIDSSIEKMGSEKLREITKSIELPQALFIVCSLSGNNSNFQSLSADGYLFKPISYRSMMDTMHQFNEEFEKILVITKNQDLVLLLTRIFQTSFVRRYKLINVSSSQEGLAVIRSETPDIILIDSELPNNESILIIDSIRSSPLSKSIPIIVIIDQLEVENSNSKSESILLTNTDGFPQSEMVELINFVVQKRMGNYFKILEESNG